MDKFNEKRCPIEGCKLWGGGKKNMKRESLESIYGKKGATDKNHSVVGSSGNYAASLARRKGK